MTVKCIRCGYWHLEAERAKGENVSCTEVKDFWVSVKQHHEDMFGHPAQLIRDENGSVICWKCHRIIRY